MIGKRSCRNQQPTFCLPSDSATTSSSIDHEQSEAPTHSVVIVHKGFSFWKIRSRGTARCVPVLLVSLTKRDLVGLEEKEGKKADFILDNEAFAQSITLAIVRKMMPNNSTSPISSWILRNKTDKSLVPKSIIAKCAIAHVSSACSYV
jgi:hypothetical protein